MSLPGWLSSRLVRQAMAAAACLLVLAAGMRLPFGVGPAVQRLVTVALARDVDVAYVAERLGAMAERGQELMTAEMGGQPGVMPASGSDGSAGPDYWLWPAEGEMTAPFGWRSTADGDVFHEGIDIGAPAGARVLATAAGTVARVWTEAEGLGLTVALEHSGGWTTRYAHLQRAEVGEGDSVRQGDVVGRVGSSGNASRPHLHFEMLRDGRQVDPEPKLRRGKQGS